MSESSAIPRGKPMVWLGAGTALLLVFVGGTLALRHHAANGLADWTRERSIPHVAIVHPHHDARPQNLALPGTIAAFYDASIHAQVTGYVKSWSRDIGALVKKGDILAEIDTPELDERLSQARQELTRAQAALQFAQMTAQRWDALRSSSAVSKQSSDEKDSDSKLKQAELGAAMANLDRLKAQKAFAKIVAPFDGVVTTRSVDIGSYVAPERGGEPLFKVADVHAVRVYVNVPQVYSARVKPGMAVRFVTPQWPGKTFESKVTTTSGAISARTGSMLAEIDFDNKDAGLLPGSYAEARFELSGDAELLRIPSSALSIGAQGARVALLGADNRVVYRPIAIAEDFGSEVAVASGLTAEDRVIDNPPDILAEGDEARVGGAPGGKP